MYFSIERRWRPPGIGCLIGWANEKKYCIWVLPLAVYRIWNRKNRSIIFIYWSRPALASLFSNVGMDGWMDGWMLYLLCMPKNETNIHFTLYFVIGLYVGVCCGYGSDDVDEEGNISPFYYSFLRRTGLGCRMDTRVCPVGFDKGDCCIKILSNATILTVII